MTIEEFKLKFGLNKKKSYNRFNNIRQKVLEPMKKDLDENATLSFNLKRHQEGNSITALTFATCKRSFSLTYFSTFS